MLILVGGIHWVQPQVSSHHQDCYNFRLEMARLLFIIFRSCCTKNSGSIVLGIFA